MSGKNKETVRKVTGALYEGDLETALEFCADDVQWTHVGEITIKGKDNVRQAMNQENPEDPPPTFTLAEPIVAEGDYVVIRGAAAITKGGKTGDFSFCQFYRFTGDKIAELDSFVVKTEAKSKTSGAA
jgi:ketosteroid isomerase-like protein